MTGKETIIAWVTKYALTSGILKVSGEVDHDIASDMFTWGGNDMQRNYAHGKDWHRTESDAKKRADEMRLKKIDFHRNSPTPRAM